METFKNICRLLPMQIVKCQCHYCQPLMTWTSCPYTGIPSGHNVCCICIYSQPLLALYWMNFVSLSNAGAHTLHVTLNQGSLEKDIDERIHIIIAEALTSFLFNADHWMHPSSNVFDGGWANIKDSPDLARGDIEYKIIPGRQLPCTMMC